VILLENGGRECDQCKRRFFGMGVRGTVTRTLKKRAWMFAVVCCNSQCFEMASKEP